MIGVSANETDIETAEEFFELFKTPWERAVHGRTYRVVLCAGGAATDFDAPVRLVYGSGDARDGRSGLLAEPVNGPVDAKWGEWTLPIYGEAALSVGGEISLVTCCGRNLVDRQQSGSEFRWRIGYNLFEEVRHLLSVGQPASKAHYPTLELHIALLRHMLLESSVPFVEVPPRPYGYDFTCCLTHDVDFFGIRRHKFDRTLAGFAARASLGTLSDVLRGRRTLGDAIRNWAAFARLPLVFLRMLPDFWQPFDDYARVEEPSRSTFFLVPFKGRPGVAPDGMVEAARAVPYGVGEIRDHATKANARGSELGVHGIDAWRDTEAGTAEMAEVTNVSGCSSAGIRMHWLYFDADTPRKLEAAGFDYDSTCGYNDAVGFRAGTSQVFRLPGTERLMELPLSIMDSALFSSGRMQLTSDQAMKLCRDVVANVERFGGAVVVNWHCRSLAPERLWDGFYKDLVSAMGDRAWFATASDTVKWFRWRRSIQFRLISSDSDVVEVSAAHTNGPAGVLHVHTPDSQQMNIQQYRIDGKHPVSIILSNSSRQHV